MRNVLIGFGSPSDKNRYFTSNFERRDGTRYFLSCNSAHRLADRVKEHAASMPFDATIAGAGMKNGLSDAFYLNCPDAIHVALPIYDPQTDGLSSILSSCEMPPGCPVAMSRLNDLPAAVAFVNYALEKPYSTVHVHDDGSNERVVADARKTFEELGVPVVEDDSANAIDVLVYSNLDMLYEFRDRHAIATFSMPAAGASWDMLDRYLRAVKGDRDVVHTTMMDGGNLALYAAKIVGRNNTEVKAAIAERFERSLGKYDPFRELIEV